jgi:hypothetical protein
MGGQVTTCSHDSAIKPEGACYLCIKIAAALIGDYSPNGHGDPTEAQLCFVGVYGAPVREPGWRPADSVAAWLEDLREPEARGVTYVVSRDGLNGAVRMTRTSLGRGVSFLGAAFTQGTGAHIARFLRYLNAGAPETGGDRGPS